MRCYEQPVIQPITPVMAAPNVVWGQLCLVRSSTHKIPSQYSIRYRGSGSVLCAGGGILPQEGREGKPQKLLHTQHTSSKYKWRKGGRPCVSFSISLYLSLEVLEVDIIWPRWVARIGVGDVIHAGVFSDGRPSVHGPFSDGPGYSRSSRTGFPGSSGVTPSPPET